MAYAIDNPIKLTAGGPGGSQRIWSYVDGDAWAAVDGSGYFNLESARLKVGDLIVGVANSVVGAVQVASNSAGVVDTTNTIHAATDSD